MKKYLPIFIFLGGALVLVAAIFLLKSGKKEAVVGENQETEEPVAEIAQDKKPYAALIPKSDGHWLKLVVEELDRLDEAKSMDYELLYKVADGRTQGVPGTVTLKGESSVTRDLLLGSESSGKFKYDVGVSQGTLTLRFRDDKGKLLGKLSTDFTLSGSSKGYTVTMDSFSKGTMDFSSE